MNASFTVTVDTSPPAVPGLMLAEGADRTADLTVSALVSSASPDVLEMKVWGDVDPAADMRISDTQAGAAWMLYSAVSFPVRLSTGSGRKRVYALLRDDVGNVTPVFGDFVDYDPASPRVTIVVPPTRARLSLVSGYDSTSFGWQASMDFVHYEVRAVPALGSSRTAGVALVSEDLARPAWTTVTSVVAAGALHAAVPGDGPKVLKVFIRTAGGTWSI